MNILLIAGGWSSEREVSLAGANIIRESLQSLGHSVRPHDPEDSLDGLLTAARDMDFAFINLHGSPGEDGLIQAMLERVGCPYQGAGPAASCLALNKAASKGLFVRAGLETAPWRLVNSMPPGDWRPDLPYPLFIKANTGGSSLHMERVREPGELFPALERLFRLDSSYLVEGAVTGREITCGVLGVLENGRERAMALPPILIMPSKSDVFDYRSKYEPGGAREICPAPIPEALTGKIQDMAVRAHRALGISGYSRADFIVPDNDCPVILEVNTLPGMTATSLLPQEAAAIGLSFAELLELLIELGLARHERVRAEG